MRHAVYSPKVVRIDVNPLSNRPCWELCNTSPASHRGIRFYTIVGFTLNRQFCQAQEAGPRAKTKLSTTTITTKAGTRRPQQDVDRRQTSISLSINCSINICPLIFVNLSFHPSICLSICLSIILSIYTHT